MSFLSGIVFVHLLVRFQRFLSLFFWLCGARQILTRLRGLRGWSFSLSQCVCVWTVLAVLWFLEWIFFWFHEDSSSSVCPALFAELGFRVCHRWRVGKWNSKIEIEMWAKTRQIYVHACWCQYTEYASKLKSILFMCDTLLVRSFGSVPPFWEIQGKHSYST